MKILRAWTRIVDSNPSCVIKLTDLILKSVTSYLSWATGMYLWIVLKWWRAKATKQISQIKLASQNLDFARNIMLMPSPGIKVKDPEQCEHLKRFIILLFHFSFPSRSVGNILRIYSKTKCITSFFWSFFSQAVTKLFQSIFLRFFFFWLPIMLLNKSCHSVPYSRT